MKQTKKIFNDLTKFINETSNLDLKKIDLVALLELDEKQILQVKKENQKIDLWKLHEFWDMKDTLVMRSIFKPLEKDIFEFIKKVHTDQFIYKTEDDPNRVKVVSMHYKYYFWDKFYLFVDPHFDFYHWSKIDRLSVHINIDYDHTEKQLRKLLDFIGIDYSDITEEDYLDLWCSGSDSPVDSVETIFTDLVGRFWKSIKKEKNSDLLGFISEATGIGSTFDLDTDEDVEGKKFATRTYIKQKGFNIEPESHGYEN